MITIVSGGQTGVDIGATDAAMECGFPVDGWLPEGRRTENGPLPNHYPLRVLSGATYPKRTWQNVIDSDNTVIIYFGSITGGTKMTVDAAESQYKKTQNSDRPKHYLLIDGDSVSVQDAAASLYEFVCQHRPRYLNFGGPRGSKERRAYPFTKAVVSNFLKLMLKNAPKNQNNTHP